MKVRVEWETTECHAATVEIEDGLDEDGIIDELGDSVLAEAEDDESYVCTTDRRRVSWEPVDG